MSDERMSFGDSEVSKTKQMKLGMKKSKFQNDVENKKKTEEEAKVFEKKSEEFLQNKNNYNDEGIKLFTKLIEVFDDKTLLSNKSIVVKNVEDRTHTDWIQLLTFLDRDPDMPECEGSLTGISLILKLMFKMKNRVNQLEYEINVLKKQVSSEEKDKTKNG